MKQTILLSAFISFFSYISLFSQDIQYKAISYGVPSIPDLIHYQQPDGSVLAYYQKGDGLINWKETPAGYCIKKAPDNFCYYLVRDKYNKLRIGNIKANETPPLKSSIKGNPYSCDVISSLREYYITSYGLSTKAFPSSGVNHLLLILVEFIDDTAKYDTTVFSQMFNETGYSGTVSFRDYYLENSYGQ